MSPAGRHCKTNSIYVVNFRPKIIKSLTGLRAVCGHKTIYSSQMLKNSHYLSFTALMVIQGRRVFICSSDHYLHIRISANREQLTTNEEAIWAGNISLGNYDFGN